MAISDNIKRIRERFDLTQEELGKIADVSSMAVSQWENDRAVPRMGAIQRISDHLGIRKSEIIEDTGRFPLGAILPSSSPAAFAPLRGRVHAGEAQEPDLLDNVVELPAAVLGAHPEGFFLEVEGDCMDKVYPEGCFIFIDPNQAPQNGSIAAVSINGAEAVMRRVYKTSNTLVLSPESFNVEHKDIIISDADGQIIENIGTVVWFQASKEME
jgi:repressor LexA